MYHAHGRLTQGESGHAQHEMGVLGASIGSVTDRGVVVPPRGSKGWHGWGLAAGVFLAMGLLTLLSGAVAQKAPDSADQGLYLVARRDMTDALFDKSVVLMLPIKGAPLLVGLIVNKPTRVPLHDLFPDTSLPKRDASAYFGGPVEVAARSALFRSATAPKNAIKVFGDVYVTFDPATIAARVESLQQAPQTRVFVGRAQWAPTQLEDETTEGSWYSLRADADAIFDPDGEGAWRKMLGRVEPRPFVERESPFHLLCQLRAGACDPYQAHSVAPLGSAALFLHP